MMAGKMAEANTQDFSRWSDATKVTMKRMVKDLGSLWVGLMEWWLDALKGSRWVQCLVWWTENSFRRL